MIRGNKNHLVDNIVTYIQSLSISYICILYQCKLESAYTRLHIKLNHMEVTHCLPLLVNTSSQDLFSLAYPFLPSFLTFDRSQRNFRVLGETEKSKVCRWLRFLLKLETKRFNDGNKSFSGGEPRGHFGHMECAPVAVN